MRKLRGFTLIELLIVVAIIAILAAIAIPNFLEAQIRSKVSRVQSDMRSLATALESYFVDNNTYPPMGWSLDTTADGGRQPIAEDSPGRTFRVRSGEGGRNQFFTLTTPVAYITTYPPDAFADTRGISFRYYHDKMGWIMGSFGPDTDQQYGGDLGWADGDVRNATPPQRTDADVETVYTSYLAQPTESLLAGSATIGDTTGRGAYTYDPTNGTVSQGDVWRVKQ
jgi:prepilin-type N-terminal cleavage/methylation domain-containing protein